ncbi:K(+)/H(+) antiporter [Entophlyctis luteolus]|nr:K(+)/H(+) antiporter [Entophlyctis luteolus]
MVASGTILTGSDPLTISALSLFLLQAIIVIGTARILAIGLRYLHQPQVIAEVLSGIVLGGSALSRIPAFKAGIFPDSSLPGFSLIGLEMDPVNLTKTLGKAVPIAFAGIVLPFAVGVAVSKTLYENYADQNVAFSSFVIFTGVAMSITAFPVLARILAERKLLHTRVGAATLSAGAMNDVVAWIFLVLVIALINQANYATAAYVFLTVAAYAIFLWVVVRRLLLRLVVYSVGREHVGQWLLFAVFVLVLFSGWFTEIIGVQAIFGSFLVGVIMPHEHGFARKLASQIEDLITIVFLPLFFAYSGLNTRLDLLNDARSWGFVWLIIFVACSGKIIGCTVAARFSGFNMRESFAVGTLMNTKGLVELIVLNLGLNAGAITVEIFTMFVVMAIVTTLLTVPIVSWIYPESYYITEVFHKDSAGVDEESIDEPEDADGTRALIYLPSIKAVPLTMTLSSLLSSGSRAFSVYALRLLHLDQRMSTLIHAAENEEAMHDDDPILHVFRTFASLNHIKANTLLALGDVSAAAPTIIDAARHTSATLVVIPQIVSRPTGSGDEEIVQTTVTEIVQPVSSALPSVPVVHFLDRQLGESLRRKKSSSSSVELAIEKEVNLSGTLQSPKLRSTGFIPTGVTQASKVVVILGGSTSTDESDLQTLRFATQLLTSSVPEGSVVPVTVHVTFALLPAVSQAVEDAVSATLLRAARRGSTVASTTMVAEASSASTKQNALDVIKITGGASAKPEAAASSSLDTIAEWSELAEVLKKVDGAQRGVVVLSKNTALDLHFAEGRLRQWLLMETKASVAVVYGGN